MKNKASNMSALDCFKAAFSQPVKIGLKIKSWIPSKRLIKPLILITKG